jgi:hypothetical protein
MANNMLEKNMPGIREVPGPGVQQRLSKRLPVSAPRLAPEADPVATKAAIHTASIAIVIDCISKHLKLGGKASGNCRSNKGIPHAALEAVARLTDTLPPYQLRQRTWNLAGASQAVSLGMGGGTTTVKQLTQTNSTNCKVSCLALLEQQTRARHKHCVLPA